MDPHSRLAQFNQRNPKTGPILQTYRYVEPSQKYTLGRPPHDYPKASSPLFSRRLIATNSRVKQDEKYRKDMYLACVNDALHQKANGYAEAFDDLVDQFNPKKASGDGVFQPAQLRLWISAFSHVVSRLERTYSALVEAIVQIPWTTMDPAIVKSYIHFTGMLLSARPEYLSLVLTNITRGFTRQSGLQASCSSMPEGSSGPLTRRVIYDRLHILLRHLYSLIPTLPSTLGPLLAHHFPHKRQEQIAQTTYIRNLLHLSEYCPELTEKILVLIIDRTVQIDVEIQVVLEDFEEEATQEEELFDLDPFDTIVGQEGDDDNSDASDSDDNLSDLSSEGGDMDDSKPLVDIPTDVHYIRDMAKKLDAILKLIFDHLNCRHPPVPLDLPLSPESLRSESLVSSTNTLEVLPLPLSVEYTKAERCSQFHTLLSIFDRTILRTFKSRYTQFLLFWYSSLDPEFSDLFQGTLVSKAVLELDQPDVTRTAAASYIAGFVSRAQFVDREGARRVTALLCSYLRRELDIFENQAHTEVAVTTVNQIVFYAISQAVLLIFCFRWRDLLEEAEEDVDELLGRPKPSKKWMPELDIVQRLVTSPLNPLKFCSSNVVMQFARIAQETGLIYCYSIMEYNRRLEYSSSGRDGSRDQRPGVYPPIPGLPSNPELTFFPFDPYMLPKSNSYIQGIYREWSSVSIHDDDDEDDDDDDDDDAEDGERGTKEDYMGEVPRRQCLDIQRTSSTDSGGLTASLDAMSISPIRVF